MELLEVTYSCPRCMGISAKAISNSGFGVAIEYIFHCARCNASLKMRYAFEFQAFKTIPRLISIEEYSPEPAAYFRRKP